MKVKLQNVRLSFPDLFEAKQFEGQGPFNYRASFLFTPDSQAKKDIDAAIKAVAAEKWGKKADALLEGILPNSQKCCLVDGNTKEYDGYEGMFALSASRNQEKGRPLIIDRDKTPLGQADGKPYAGCYVNATVEIWAQDNNYGKGIRANLLAVQFARDGDAFAGGSVGSEEDFDDLSADADSADSLV
jgi:Protein of unknown function (DUF2815).